MSSSLERRVAWLVGQTPARLWGRLARASRRESIALVALSLAAYGLAFAPLFARLGPAVGAFGFVPGILAGALLGARAGVYVALVIVPLHVVLFARFGLDPNGIVPAAFMVGVVGVVVGRQRALSGALRGQQTDLLAALDRATSARRELHAEAAAATTRGDAAPGLARAALALEDEIDLPYVSEPLPGALARSSRGSCAWPPSCARSDTEESTTQRKERTRGARSR